MMGWHLTESEFRDEWIEEVSHWLVNWLNAKWLISLKVIKVDLGFEWFHSIRTSNLPKILLLMPTWLVQQSPRLRDWLSACSAGLWTEWTESKSKSTPSHSHSAGWVTLDHSWGDWEGLGRGFVNGWERARLKGKRQGGRGQGEWKVVLGTSLRLPICWFLVANPHSFKCTKLFNWAYVEINFRTH